MADMSVEFDSVCNLGVTGGIPLILVKTTAPSSWRAVFSVVGSL